MIDSLPPKAVLKAAAREQRMLEGALALGQTLPSEDTVSILNFCRFLGGAVHGRLVLPRTMPMELWMFYVKSVGRLVAAEELPREVKDEIEEAFHNVFCCIMA